MRSRVRRGGRERRTEALTLYVVRREVDCVEGTLWPEGGGSMGEGWGAEAAVAVEARRCGKKERRHVWQRWVFGPGRI